MLRRTLDWPWPYFLGAGLLLVAMFFSLFDVRFSSRSSGKIEELASLRGRQDLNVVFILIDTLRADRLGAYGYGRPTSPHLDQLARQGIRFAHVASQSSWTKTSMASLWTGTYPASNGILRWDQGLPASATMPAEILQQAGLRTAGIFRNGWLAGNFGFSQGFATYYMPKPSATPAKFARQTPSAHPLHGSDADVTEAATEFLRSFGKDRFFLYLHLMDVHQYAFDTNALLFGTSYSDFYDSALSWVDRNVGAILRAVDDQGALGRTLVVVAADHGEGFMEHGQEGHGRTLYREVTEVPLIVSLPFALDRGVVVEPLVQNADIWPTILDMAGMPALPAAQGRSLVPLIEAAGEGASPPPDLAERAAYGELDRTWGIPKQEPKPIVAVMNGPWRLIQDVHGVDPPELFDRAADPWEKQNVANSRPEVLGQMQALSTQYLQLPEAPWGKPQNVQLDAMRLEQLKALGYVVK
jgi:arylsulfatase A-like enzyme